MSSLSGGSGGGGGADAAGATGTQQRIYDVEQMFKSKHENQWNAEGEAQETLCLAAQNLAE